METPVLLLTYNRPQLTKRVLNRLQDVGINQVYVSIDGPKTTEDQAKINEIRQVLDLYNSHIVATKFSGENLGCRNAVINGINWFFSHVEEGMILEDDCLPSKHFFPYATQLLNKHRNNQEIGMISGNNPLGKWDNENDLFCSRIGHIWGWATWKNRWLSFDPKLPKIDDFINSKGFKRAFGPTKLALHRKQLTLDSLNGKIDTWDYQWTSHLLMKNQLAITPRVNLVENIGLEGIGTNINHKPKWISNSTSQIALDLTSLSMEADREYEMEVELTRHLDSQTRGNSATYHCIGAKKEELPKVLIINSTDIGGGAEKISLSIFEELQKRGCSVQLLVSVKKSDRDCVVEIRDFQKQVEAFNPDILHVHNLHGTNVSLAQISAIAKRHPVLFTLHDTWLLSGKSNHPFTLSAEMSNLLELKARKKTLKERLAFIENPNVRFTAPSQWMRELFVTKMRKYCHYIPNGVDEIASKEFVDIPSKNYILFVANNPETNPYKDYQTLVFAWEKANEHFNEKGCDLIVIGGTQSIEKVGNQRLIKMAKQPNYTVRELMRNARLVIQSSKLDNAPLTILESHSAGTKVIGSLVGGIPEMLDTQEQSWLFTAGSVVELASNLAEALSKQQNGSTLTHATTETMVNTYIGHYIELTNA